MSSRDQAANHLRDAPRKLRVLADDEHPAGGSVRTDLLKYADAIEALCAPEPTLVLWEGRLGHLAGAIGLGEVKEDVNSIVEVRLKRRRLW